jgi:CHRD domain
MPRPTCFPLLAGLLLMGTLPTQAATLTFRAQLTGTAAPTNTGSNARGTAILRVNTAKQVVSIDLRVNGITLDGLWDNLVKAPVGPIHLHQYGSKDHGADDVKLALPLPYGPSYRSTKTGFRVRLENHPYAAGAQLVQSTATIDQFVAALREGRIVLNIHTDRNNEGEISGTVRLQ